MNMRKIFMALGLCAGFALAPVLQRSSAAPQAFGLTWFRAGDVAGGAQVSSAGYRLHGSAGQSVAGSTASTSYKLCTGVQCVPAGGASRGVYLPTVVR